MQGRFIVHLPTRFCRDLERLPQKTQKKVLDVIKRLEVDPFGPAPKVKKLKGKGIDQWRLEIWPYRLRYDVEGRDIILYRVRHRKEIYRD